MIYHIRKTRCGSEIIGVIVVEGKFEEVFKINSLTLNLSKILNEKKEIEGFYFSEND